MIRALPVTITKVYDNILPTCFIAKLSLAAHYSRCLVTNTTTIPTDMAAEQQQVRMYQNVLVMRHGDRLDNLDKSWPEKNPTRSWDPPLTKDGRTRARIAGVNIRAQLGLPIRIFVSPFLRCVETAYEVIYGLCGVEDGNDLDANVDSFIGKVSIEYGLSEMFNKVAIRHPPTDPKNGDWGFIRADLEELLPQHTVDPKAYRVFNKLPQWDEKKEEAAGRFKRVIDELADRYPLETLLLITHGEGVGVAAKHHSDSEKIKVPGYCSYAQLRRPVLENSETFAGMFGLECIVAGPEIHRE